MFSSWFSSPEQKKQQEEARKQQEEEKKQQEELRQQEAFNTLKSRFPEQTDATINRFLRARKHDVELSSTMLSNFLKWRAEFGEVSASEFEEELKMGLFYYHGTTKTGSPVVVSILHRFFPKKIDRKRILRLCVWVMEALMAVNPETESFSVIVDYAGFGWANVDYDLTKELAKIYLDYYPEVLEREFVLNTPWIFRGLWAWAKGWLDEHTAEKIWILKPEEASQRMLEYIDEYNLQRIYGGKSTWKFENFEQATAENPMLGIPGKTFLPSDFPDGSCDDVDPALAEQIESRLSMSAAEPSEEEQEIPPEYAPPSN
jgi:hypothetical protein